MKPHSVRMDALRGIAALLVVIGHARALTVVEWSGLSNHSLPTLALYSLTRLGGQSVACFFVLSGYWVGGQIFRAIGCGDFSWESYLIRRMTRLLIVLLPALFTTSVVMLLGQTIFADLPLFTDSAVSSAVIRSIDSEGWGWTPLLGALFFMQPGVSEVPALNGPLWSLGLEFWCYLLAPAAALAAVNKRRTPAVGIAVVSLAMLGLGGFEYALLWVLGCIISVRPSLGVTVQLIGDGRLRLLTSSSILCVSAFLSSLPSVPTLLAVAIMGFATAEFITSSASDPERAVGNALSRNLAKVGRFSYSLYLTHLPILSVSVALLYQRLSFGRTDRPVAALGFIATGVVIAVMFGKFFSAIFESRTILARCLIEERAAVRMRWTSRVRVWPWERAR